MSDQRCKTCQHFVGPNYLYPPFGYCNEAFRLSSFGNAARDYQRDVVFAFDHETNGHAVTVMVGPDFCCKHWEPQIDAGDIA